MSAPGGWSWVLVADVRSLPRGRLPGLLERAPDMAAGFPRASGTGEQGERAVPVEGVLSVRHCPFCPV